MNTGSGDGGEGRRSGPAKPRTAAAAHGGGAPGGGSAPVPPAARVLRPVLLAAGEAVPCLGLGTWAMGNNARDRPGEVRAIRHGIDLGMTLVDTAEMYADGGAEEMLAEALAGRRERVFVVSKVYPHNAGRRSAIAACEASLGRLRTDRLDLYLLHWRGRIPLAETVEAFERLHEAGKIRHWGVSNFDVDDMEALLEVAGPDRCACNQVLYNPGRRGIEWDLLPWMRERHIPVMAYSPIEQGRLLGEPVFAQIAGEHGATPAAVALAWLLRHPDVIAIPKSVSLAHLDANRSSHDLELGPADIARIDARFPPPDRAAPLSML